MVCRSNSLLYQKILCVASIWLLRGNGEGGASPPRGGRIHRSERRPSRSPRPSRSGGCGTGRGGIAMRQYTPEQRKLYAEQICALVREWISDQDNDFDIDIKRGVEWHPDLSAGGR